MSVDTMQRATIFGVGMTLALLASVANAQADREDASTATRQANALVAESLPFENTADFDLASQGLIGRKASLIIRDDSGRVVWNADQFDFVAGDAPQTVNPSLWRQARLLSMHGLYEVTDRIYQVRGYDISNLAVIEGETGYIVVDPLITREVAQAAMELVYEHLPKKPVVAVIYSHSHADHFGGVKGVVSEEQVQSGATRIIASEGFMDHAVAENILAGNVMTRRASYMFGSLLPKDARGGVGSGIGNAISAGEVTLIEPTDIITATPQEIVIDGVRMVFMNTPFAEAPAELMFYLPDMKAFYASEEANATMHNLYTLRGALVRDALLWSGYLHEAADLIAKDTEVLFGGHHWPRRGYDNIVDYLRKQGDMYRYVHDQTLRLANHGFTMDEIPGRLDLPAELGQQWFNRGYYGTVSHNSRAVYNKYLGYFDGNPANLNPLPPAEAGRKYVEFMGGADALLAKARKAYDAADYRWVAEVVNHLVFAEPGNDAARELQANALEQLGYQAESAQWRNFYLTASAELRNGVMNAETTRTVSADMINALTLDMFFDFMAVRLNGPKAGGRTIVLNFELTDTGERYVVDISNAVLHHRSGASRPDADATIKLTRDALVALTLAGAPLDALQASGSVTVSGDSDAARDLIAMLDSFEFWFNIVTP